MPINGHQPPQEPMEPASAEPEHDWGAASAHVFPALRPRGTQGMPMDELDAARLAHEGTKTHALPLLDNGPADLALVYVLRQPAYDVVVNADHLLTWGVGVDALRGAAMANLEAWSAAAPWTDELDGQRHLLSSDTGDGSDAARILLPEVRRHLAGECGGPARVIVGLPDRDLLVAGSLNPGDEAFGQQFAAFVADLADGAAEPIAEGLFELVGDEHELVPFRS